VGDGFRISVLILELECEDKIENRHKRRRDHQHVSAAVVRKYTYYDLVEHVIAMVN